MLSNERKQLLEVSEREHVTGMRNRMQRRVRDILREMETDPARRLRRYFTGYDQRGHGQCGQIGAARGVVERRPEIEGDFVDSCGKCAALRCWQGVPCALAAPVVDEAAHRSEAPTSEI